MKMRVAKKILKTLEDYPYNGQPWWTAQQRAVALHRVARRGISRLRLKERMQDLHVPPTQDRVYPEIHVNGKVLPYYERVDVLRCGLR